MSQAGLTSVEFQAMLDDESKSIHGDLAWKVDQDHSHCVEFQAAIHSAPGWPIFVKGSYNPLIPALSFVLIHKQFGRIYALDMGKDHHNPQCNQVGEKHKHRWSEQYRDKEAYVPEDITESVHEPVKVWRQFCREANIQHEGNLAEPPPCQGDLFQ